MGISAFMPHFNRPAASGAQSYKYGIQGGPALYHHAPTTDTAPSPDLGDLAQAGYARSTNAPDAWYIDDYNLTGNRAEYPGAGMPVILPDNGDMASYRSLIPVPAGNLVIGQRRDSALLSVPGVLNRVKQIPWWPRTWSAPFAGKDAR
jgi:hypothetical protein